MVPSSEELEAFSARLTQLRTTMAARGAAQIPMDSPLRGAVAIIARDWLRLSERLRIGGVSIDLSTLASCDSPGMEQAHFSGALRSSKNSLPCFRSWTILNSPSGLQCFVK